MNSMASHSITSHTTCISRTILEEDESTDGEDGPHMLFSASFEEENVLEALYENRKACYASEDKQEEENLQQSFPFSPSFPSHPVSSQLMQKHGVNRVCPQSPLKSCPVSNLGTSRAQKSMASSPRSLARKSNGLGPNLNVSSCTAPYHRRNKSTTDVVVSSMKWIQSSVLAEDGSGSSNSSSDDDDSITQEFNVASAGREQQLMQQLRESDQSLQHWFEYANFDEGIDNDVLLDENLDVPWVVSCSFHSAEENHDEDDHSSVGIDLQSEHYQDCAALHEQPELRAEVKRRSTINDFGTDRHDEEKETPFLMNNIVNEEQGCAITDHEEQQGCERHLLKECGILYDNYENANALPGTVSCSFHDEDDDDDFLAYQQRHFQFQAQEQQESVGSSSSASSSSSTSFQALIAPHVLHISKQGPSTTVSVFRPQAIMLRPIDQA